MVGLRIFFFKIFSQTKEIKSALAHFYIAFKVNNESYYFTDSMVYTDNSNKLVLQAGIGDRICTERVKGQGPEQVLVQMDNLPRCIHCWCMFGQKDNFHNIAELLNSLSKTGAIVAKYFMLPLFSCQNTWKNILVRNIIFLLHAITSNIV